MNETAITTLKIIIYTKNPVMKRPSVGLSVKTQMIQKSITFLLISRSTHCSISEQQKKDNFTHQNRNEHQIQKKKLITQVQSREIVHASCFSSETHGPTNVCK